MKTASPSDEKEMSDDRLVAPASDAVVDVQGVTETGGVLMASGRNEASPMMAGARLLALLPPAKCTTRAEEQGLDGGQQDGAVTRRCTSDFALFLRAVH